MIGIGCIVTDPEKTYYLVVGYVGYVERGAPVYSVRKLAALPGGLPHPVGEPLRMPENVLTVVRGYYIDVLSIES